MRKQWATALCISLLLAMGCGSKQKSSVSTAPATHKIVRCETKLLTSKDGPKSAIFIAADLYNAAALDALVNDLVAEFKVHRMMSPPETSVMLVTIVGPCEASDFSTRWRKRVAEDQAAAFWMGRMEKAEVGVSPSSGPVTTTYSSILPEGHL